MTSIAKEGNKLLPDDVVELFKFDTTVIGGSDVLTLISSETGTTAIVWDTETYTPFPFKFEGMERVGDGTAVPRPTLSVSNVSEGFRVALLNLGDLTGTAVTRVKTFHKFTDLGTEPNTSAFITKDVMSLTRKISQNKHIIQYELGYALDRPNLKLPRRQILKRDFPGVSRIRGRS